MPHKRFAENHQASSRLYDPYHVVESFRLARQCRLPDFASPQPSRHLVSLTEPDMMSVVQKDTSPAIIEYYSRPLKTVVRADPQPDSSRWLLSSWTVSGVNDDSMVALALSVCRMDDSPPMLTRILNCTPVKDSGTVSDKDFRDGHTVSAAIISFAQESQLVAAVTVFAQ